MSKFAGPPHRMPESRRAFCKIVSFTAANTSRIYIQRQRENLFHALTGPRHSGSMRRTFDVSVACVRCG
jgi:hypothetical protein